MSTISISHGVTEKLLWWRVLVFSGIFASLLYVAMNIFIPMGWAEYSSFSQTVSELSAISAPTRPIWVPLGIIYTLLMAVFGWGLLKAAVSNRPLRIVGIILIIYGLTGLAWPPMHLREVLASGGATFTDTLHVVFTFATILLMILAMAFGAAAFGIRFRIYTIVTIMILGVFGMMTGNSVPDMEANLPTPWMGVWERINIGVFLLWVIVLAAIVLRSETFNEIKNRKS